MAIFNLIVRIIFFVCLGWSACLVVFFLIYRHVKRKQAKKDVLNNEVKADDKKE